MYRPIISIIAALLLSGCSSFPQLSTGSKIDLGTTAIALSMGAREVGIASVCGSNTVAVLGCVYGMKLLGEKYLGNPAMDISGKLAGAWNATQIIKMGVR